MRSNFFTSLRKVTLNRGNFFVLSDRFLRLIFGLVIIFIGASKFSDAVFGSFLLAQFYCTTAILLARGGIDQLMITKFRRTEGLISLFRLARLILNIIFILLLCLYLLYYNEFSFLTIVFLIPVLFSHSNVTEYYLISKNKRMELSIFSIVIFTFSFFVKLISILFYESINLLACTFAFESIIYYIIINKLFYPEKVKLLSSHLKLRLFSLFSIVKYYFLTTLLSVYIFRIDQIIISRFLDISDFKFYNISVRFIEVSFIVAPIINEYFLTFASKKNFIKHLQGQIVLGVLFSLTLFIISPIIFELFFDGYNDSMEYILKIYSWSLFFIFINNGVNAYQTFYRQHSYISIKYFITVLLSSIAYILIIYFSNFENIIIAKISSFGLMSIISIIIVIYSEKQRNYAV